MPNSPVACSAGCVCHPARHIASPVTKRCRREAASLSCARSTFTMRPSPQRSSRASKPVSNVEAANLPAHRSSPTATSSKQPAGRSWTPASSVHAGHHVGSAVHPLGSSPTPGCYAVVLLFLALLNAFAWCRHRWRDASAFRIVSRCVEFRTPHQVPTCTCSPAVSWMRGNATCITPPSASSKPPVCR